MRVRWKPCCLAYRLVWQCNKWRFLFLRVSSVLNRDTKQFGKKHLVDNDDDTCWNSDQVFHNYMLLSSQKIHSVLLSECIQNMIFYNIWLFGRYWYFFSRVMNIEWNPWCHRILIDCINITILAQSLIIYDSILYSIFHVMPFSFFMIYSKTPLLSGFSFRN